MLRPHPTAQRTISPGRIKYLRSNLNLDAIGTLHAVEYAIEGKWAIWIVDGQHRWRTLMDEDVGDWEVDVMIHLEDGDDAKASALFLLLNNRTTIRPFDKFEQLRLSGDDAAISIHALVTGRGLTLAQHSGDGIISCVVSLQNVHKMGGDAAVGCTLDTLIAAWGHTADAMEGRIVEGIGRIYCTYGEQVEQAALVKRLAKQAGGPAGIIGEARGLGKVLNRTIARCVADIAIKAYNTGRTTNKLKPL
jgi:hypothetical protein